MGQERCEGGDLDAPEGSWVHVAFAFDHWEKLNLDEKHFPAFSLGEQTLQSMGLGWYLHCLIS